jgi:phage-related protein
VIGGVLTVVIAAWVADVVAGAAESAAAFLVMLGKAILWAAGTEAAAAETNLAWLAANAEMLGAAIASAAGILVAWAPLIVGIAAVGIAAYELYQHWSAVWGAIQAVFETVWNVIKTVFGAIVSFIKEHAAIIVGAIMLIAPPIGLIIVAVHELYTHWSTVWNAIKTVTSAVAGVLRTIFGAIAGAGLDVIKGAVSALQTVWGAAWGAIKSVASSAWSVMSPVFHAIVNVGIALVKREIQGLQTVWNGVWNGILTVVEAIWSVLEPIFNTIKTAIHDITGGLGKVAGIAGKIGGAVGGIGHALGFASGTDYAPGGLAHINELGGEVVDLPRGSRVYPHGVTPPSGGGDIHVHLEGPVYGANARELADKVVDAINARVRETGAVFRSGAVLTA